jgi:hypothetical protein
MQAKDIPEVPVLKFLHGLNRLGTTFLGFDNSVANAMPDGVNVKLVCAKMKAMERKGLVIGCYCGCRGDWKLTAKGRDFCDATVR